MKTLIYDEASELERDAQIQLLADMLTKAPKIAFLTGAGSSTSSGIPDFRSSSGVYQTTSEEFFSIDFFCENPEKFYANFASFYRVIAKAKPNAGHLAVAELERRCGKRVDVVTQNIDGLHRAAGSTRVWEIHGTLRTASCLKCEKQYADDYFREDVAAGRVPRCQCGGILKPDVVFYGENLPERAYIEAERAMWETRSLIVLGTSLQVYPAAGLPRECDAGTPFVVINKTPTQLDSQASLVFYAPIDKILPEAVARVQGMFRPCENPGNVPTV